MAEEGRRAVILAAGAGSRLRDVAPVKPLVEVQGKALILHAIEAVARVGVGEVIVVVGHEGDAIRAALKSAPLPVRFTVNERWADTPNGVSLLTAKAYVAPGTLLLMSDHLLSPALVARLVGGATAPLALAVDQRLGHPWIDEADVTRVRTEAITDDGPDGAGAGEKRRILAIGKGLLSYDCYDTGLFRIGPELIAALEDLPAPSLSEGVSLLAGRGLAEAVPIGDAPWLDVDDARALKIAREEWPCQIGERVQ